jgi:hypothetical protein
VRILKAIHRCVIIVHTASYVHICFACIQPTQCWLNAGKSDIHRCDHFYQTWKNKSAWSRIDCAKQINKSVVILTVEFKAITILHTKTRRCMKKWEKILSMSIEEGVASGFGQFCSANSPHYLSYWWWESLSICIDSVIKRQVCTKAHSQIWYFLKVFNFIVQRLREKATSLSYNTALEPLQLS